MRILIAEDDPLILEAYVVLLEGRGHTVKATANGSECVRAYTQAASYSSAGYGVGRPFDALLLDYMMPEKDGMQVAREILALNPRQRIIFASAFVKETLQESISELGRVIELVQKPFGMDTLVNVIEDTEIYSRLEKLNVDVKALREVHPTHDQIEGLLKGLGRIMNTPF